LDKVKRNAAGASNFLLYGVREPADMGPSLNKRKKGMVVLGCAVLGGVTGGMISLATEQEGGEQAVQRTTSIAVGAMCGVVLGIWVVPESFSYDDNARERSRILYLAKARHKGIRASIWQGKF